MCKPNYGGIVLLPLLLASCIGGNFGVQPVVESTPTAYPVTFKSKDVPTPPPAKPSIEIMPVNRPAVGAAMRLPRRNTAFHREDGTEIPNSKQAEEKLSFQEGDVLFLYGSKGNKLQQLKSEIHKRDSDVEIRTSEKENKKYDYKFVDAGYVYVKGKDEIKWTSDYKQFSNRLGYDGFVYYSGERPSQSLPSAGTVEYSGNWQYMTDAKRHRAGKAVGIDNLGYYTFYGNDVGATSYAAKDVDEREKHPAKYTVDFGNKTLTGELIKNQYVKPSEKQKPLTIYNITADLNGNRFTGSAKVNPDLAKSHANKEHLFFHADADQRLEGGFFGDKGEELAGRFISNDNSVFGVFAGKQNSPVPSGKHTKILDSLKISVDEASGENPRPFAISPMPDFGHPDKLLVEGHEIPLVSQEKTIELADGRKMTVSACCDFLTYVKLGRIKTDRPASKPKAEDENSEDEIGESEENEEDLVAEEENTEDEVVEDEDREEDEVSEDGNSEDEEEIAEEDDDEAEEEEVEETEEESPVEESGGDSGSILPTPEAPKGRDIDLFLKGIRTAEADIPKTGTAHYTGTWEARIGVPADGTTFIQKDNYANQGAKAEFDVDFGAKSLSGKLTEKNDTTPAFYIEKGVIDGNGFHALAHTRENGIDLSGQGSTNPKNFKADNLLVTGGFYGPQAAELGGNIIDSDRKFGAVFGAKKDDKEATR
ncbi:TPA: transferrin-binding protein-like solute binding protein [Neisseria meningitidis]|uniref:transferrin-binding protein-like solute binding protein n=1 Tax=Neisseria meningitidis TaxID=487 RepID=UPI0002A50610|nr:transferrin-binding protein-like solute binding protein [Neisseria meningitidis]ELL21006.1 transferrin binding -like solute binding family protein [Neisseria meningitidis 2007056]CEZ23805.1 lactoferrin-binding protein [Neisseria meningitidis]CFB01200.1 lactoferrin-binding protein [Neisseria meningitidis]CKK76383.1 lactoferrin-binding protein [Neisseria meningitidis]CKK79429.1 lactoferrin-binding protein [Neisseria meningitidis]